MMPLVNGMEKSSNNLKGLDVEKLVSNLLINKEEFNGRKIQKESKSDWMVDLQRMLWIEKSSNNGGQFQRLRHQSSRMNRRFIRKDRGQRDPRNQYNTTTRQPRTINIFAPSNGDRFDAWGG